VPTLEPATLADARAIAEVHVVAWRAAYAGLVSEAYLDALSVDERAATWAETIASGTPEVLVARAGGAVVGFVAFGPCRDAGAPPTRGEIWAFYVLPSRWGGGLGRAMWHAARERLAAQGRRGVSLWVLAGNARGLAFYTSVGFALDPASRQTFRLGDREIEEVRMAHG
jgi:ribosomal protein S18 acetylase RimI-like enzyme